ncbi:MAG: hypothetical protein IJ542_01225 [Clostridia bacterium]|nr:hypothetical protein [Clostridia bacterium]
MKKLRLANVLSLVCNLSIVYFTIDAVWYSFRTDVIRDPKWFGYTGIHSLRFFTVLSNIFVAIIAILFVIKTIKNLIEDKYEFPHWMIVLKQIATAGVALTFATVVTMLAPASAITGKGYFSMFEHNNLFMHLLTPILAIVSFVFFEREKPLRIRESFWFLIPVIIYSIVYTIMVVFIGEANGGWKDFYNFTLHGKMWLAPLAAVGMLGFAFLVSWLLVFCHNKWQKRQERKLAEETSALNEPDSENNQ